MKIKEHALTEVAFDKHMRDTVDTYNKLFFLNLLSGEKADEARLSNRAINMVKSRT